MSMYLFDEQPILAKEKNKESIRKAINKFKEMAKDSISKDKVKNKQKEQMSVILTS